MFKDLGPSFLKRKKPYTIIILKGGPCDLRDQFLEEALPMILLFSFEPKHDLPYWQHSNQAPLVFIVLKAV